MTRFGMIIDVTNCTGCYNCFLACRDEHAENDYPPYSAAQPVEGQNWMQVREIERGRYPRPKVSYVPTPCMHCQSTPCATRAEDGAVRRRADGIVIFDPGKAKAQEAIVHDCPYRVVSWNEELSIPQKCTLCAHRLDEGEKRPRCVESCPTGALIFGDLDDSTSEVAAGWAKAEPLHPEFGADPLVRYIGLPRRFIAGEVVLADRQGECASGVRVLLEGPGGRRETASDAFGDFEFEDLEVGEYVLTVEHEGYRARTSGVRLKGDVYLGEILLERDRIGRHG